MNICKSVSLSALLATSSVFASGFGLYEASAPTYALGGAVVGRAYDASANFFNPATLTDLSTPTVTAGFMTEHPRGRIKVNGHAYEPMNPGAFLLPHFHLATPLPGNFAFGLGMMPEYGLGSAYDERWSLCNNSQETTVQSFTLNPNLAWKWHDLSIGGGLRFLFFDFEQYSLPASNPNNPALRFHNRLKGDNDMRDFGWQLGVKYDLTDNLSLGLVYKSSTLVRIYGKASNTAMPTGNPMIDDNLRAAALGASGSADTELELPQSITGGFNWDITDTVHLGGTVAWTQWSSVDTLQFHLPSGLKPIHLNWKDTWRAGLAPAWDFAEDWTAMCSYIYETDCSADQDSTMLPAADRHMLSAGLNWRCWRGLEISLCYGIILMDGKSTHATAADGTLAEYRAYRGLSHAAGLTFTYRF